MLYLVKKFPLCRRVQHENATEPPYYHLEQADERILDDGSIGLEISGNMETMDVAETFVILKIL